MGDCRARRPTRLKAWISTIAPEDAEGRLEKIYRRAKARAGGVANIVRIQSLNPPALEAHLGLYRSIMFGDSELSRAEREMIAVAVSHANGCHY